MKKFLLALMIFSIAIASAYAAVIEVPALTTRINDSAGMFKPATVQHLTSILKQFETKDSTQIMILTVATLNGEPIESFATRCYDKYKLGLKGKDNGVLIIFAKNDRKWRVEVGRGLQGVLTDVKSAEIMKTFFVPKAKAGDFDGGITDAINAMLKRINGEFKAAGETPPASSKEHGLMFWVIVAFLVVGIIIFLAATDMLWILLIPFGGDGGSGGGGGDSFGGGWGSSDGGGSSGSW